MRRLSKRPEPGVVHARAARDLATTGAVCVFLAVLVWIVFGQTIGHEFLNYDDNVYVYDQPKVAGGLNFGGVGWAFTHVHADNWHPITTISHMFDCQLYGLQPWGHHLTNVLLHGVGAILLFLALRQLTGRLWPSAFVAALFAIHPLRVESVAWVAERKDVLSGVFFMLTLWLYAHYARSAHDDRIRPVRYFAVIACFALGLLCKPTLVTVPFVLLLLDYWPLRRFQSREGKGERLALLAEKIPLFLLSAASCVATILAQKEALATTGRLTFQERFANAAVSYVAYLGQMIYPGPLTVLTPYARSAVSAAEVVIALVVLWLISAVLFLGRRTYPFLLTGWLWYLGMLVPMIGIVQVGWQTRADRYTYLPQIGLGIATTWAAMELFRRSRRRRQTILTTTALLILITLATRSYLQARYWKDSETLWKHAIELNPDNYIAHNNLGDLVMEKGLLDDAILHFRKAVAINSEYAEAQYNLGNALAAENRYAEAIAAFEAAAQIRPSFYQVHNNLGCMLVKVGKRDDALNEFNAALRIHRDYQEAHLNLGHLLSELGRMDESKAHLTEAERLKANQADAGPGAGNRTQR